MERDVREFFSACSICARNKTSNKPSSCLLRPRPIPSHPWSHIALDFTGLPPSSINTGILTIIDRFSKAAHFIPLSKLPSARETANLLTLRKRCPHSMTTCTIVIAPGGGPGLPFTVPPTGLNPKLTATVPQLRSTFQETVVMESEQILTSCNPFHNQDLYKYSVLPLPHGQIIISAQYIAIVHPTSEKRTIQWTIIINILVWVGSFLLTVPVMIYAMVVRKSDLEICMMFLDGPEDMYWYTLYQSILGFIFPLIIISTFYSLTLYHVFRSIRRVKRKQTVWAKRATKTVVMVIALFLVCWSPYHVIQVINLSNNRPTNTFVYVYNISICLSYSHSCINPLMLLIFAQNYRERLCHRKELRSSQQNSSKTTVVKTDGASVSTDPNYRSTAM
ncbi:delta-type opioid receptor-like [Oncorhynchus masou masou]|uniref:delta-type opioid receptor-like n=1 Tax=Oncorhynchus masou masou TaxID=90313 RepID=UPI003184034E